MVCGLGLVLSREDEETTRSSEQWRLEMMKEGGGVDGFGLDSGGCAWSSGVWMAWAKGGGGEMMMMMDWG